MSYNSPFYLPIIPPITDELGKYWNAPQRENIDMTLSHAWMNKDDFQRLHHYQHTLPTGVYEGKMWKRLMRDGGTRLHWFLAWFGPSNEPNKCSINYQRIGIKP